MCMQRQEVRKGALPVCERPQDIVPAPGAVAWGSVVPSAAMPMSAVAHSDQAPLGTRSSVSIIGQLGTHLYLLEQDGAETASPSPGWRLSPLACSGSTDLHGLPEYSRPLSMPFFPSSLGRFY